MGYSGFKGTIFDQNHEFRQGIYRFNPSRKSFEFLTNTSNNTWGLGITEDNSVFASTANNTHSVFMAIPNGYFAGVEGIPTKGSSKIDGHYAMQPLTPNIRQVDVFGGFTAAAGHHFYTARNYPQGYWNKAAFVCEPTGGLVHIANIDTQGAGYSEIDGGNLFASSDEWVSPVEAKVGPDGAVWVLDWYNFIVQHNPTPTVDRGGYDAENGLGNAHVNPLRDKSRGRIWRVVSKNNSSGTNATVQLSKENPEELIQALSNDNMFWRLTAQRLLIERGKTDIKQELYQLIGNESVDAMGLNPGALHAIWVLEGLNILPEDDQAEQAVIGALSHPSGALRKAAIQVLPRTSAIDNALLEAVVLQDKNPQVQLAAILYFSGREASESIGRELYELSQNQEIRQDKWLARAVYIAATKHLQGFMTAFSEANPDYKQQFEESRRMQSESFNQGKLSESVANMFYSSETNEGNLSGFEENPEVINLGTIKNEMKYDVTEFVVEAGKPVELIFENNDFMQHNVVIGKRGTVEKIGVAADKLATDPSGPDKAYVPQMPEVLFATSLVDPQQTAVLRFIAPDRPGLYPYLCTFPGHWRIMQGVMKVVASNPEI